MWVVRKRRIKNDSKGLGLNNWENGVDTKMRNTSGRAGSRVMRRREIGAGHGHGECEMPIRHPRGELKEGVNQYA